MKKFFPSKKTLIISFIIAMIFTIFGFDAEINLNPQGEYYDYENGSVQWRTVIEFGLVTFSMGYLFIFLIAYIMEMLWKADAHLLKDGEHHEEGRDIEKDE